MRTQRPSQQQGSALQRVRGVLGMHCVDIALSEKFKDALRKHIAVQGYERLEDVPFSQMAWAVASTLKSLYGMEVEREFLGMSIIQWDMYYALTGMSADEDPFLGEMYATAIGGDEEIKEVASYIDRKA